MSNEQEDGFEIGPDVLKGMPSNIDSSQWARTSIKSLYLENFGRHKNAFFDFTDNGKPLGLACLVGPNGSGKTTVLTAVQLLFNNYADYDASRYESMMTKYVRNYFAMSSIDLGKANFMVRGVFTTGTDDYEVAITRKEVLYRHPPEIEEHLMRYLHAARFDQELHMFQVKRAKWENFKRLYLSVTGLRIEEVGNVFDDTSDKRLQKINEEYVTNFKFLNKGEDIFTNRVMSAGERKVTKCFSTIYNLTVQPCIILIDNVTDHIELSRHLPLMDGLASCFSGSQLLVTCHSAPVQRNFDRSKVYDMRFLNAKKEVFENPWKLRLADEIRNALDKVVYSSTCSRDAKAKLTQQADHLERRVLELSQGTPEFTAVAESIKDFLSNIYKHYVVDDLVTHPPLKLRGG